MEMKTGSSVRFINQSRHGDWEKGDLAKIAQTVAIPPLNQFHIYILQKYDGKLVWATNQDIEKYDQLSLF